MDVRMPELDGISATRQIREIPRVDAKTIPIVAMTANTFEEDVKNCLDAGMNYHLAKPVQAEYLYRVLAEYIK
jgi:CheY-like chemotaxis protein